MAQCLVFCRTNHDCDNLEAFLTELGGGGGTFRGARESGRQNPYACAVLAGRRGMQQRREALEVGTPPVCTSLAAAVGRAGRCLPCQAGRALVAGA